MNWDTASASKVGPDPCALSLGRGLSASGAGHNLFMGVETLGVPDRLLQTVNTRENPTQSSQPRREGESGGSDEVAMAY